MEDDIGVRLFHRGTRKITLTNEGMLLRRRAEEILQLVDNTEKELVEQEDIEKYEFMRLKMREKWVVLMRPDDELAKKGSVNAKDLSKLPMILPRRLNMQSELASWFGDYYADLQVLFTSNLNTNGAVMVRNGLGYSVVIEGSVPFWDHTKITYRPLSPELTATCVLAWERQQPFSLAATKFIGYAKCLLGMNKS